MNNSIEILSIQFGERFEISEYISDGLQQSQLYLNVGDRKNDNGIVETFSVSENIIESEIYFNLKDQKAKNVISRAKMYGITPNNIHLFKLNENNQFIKYEIH